MADQHELDEEIRLDALQFTFDELLAEDPYEEPLIASGVRCHGGYVDGNYVSPRGPRGTGRRQEDGEPRADDDRMTRVDDNRGRSASLRETARLERGGHRLRARAPG